ncbi:MAG: PEP-CTERM sorting domain-containing protein [Terracidiphilus sp.]
MLKSLRNLAVVALAVIGLAAASSAKADPTEILNMTFESGATFSGIVTFAPDYSSIEAVTGTLTDYQYGTYGYTGTGSDSINWIINELNLATPATPGDIYGNFLLDAQPNSFWSCTSCFNIIDFTYDYTNAPVLVFDNNPDDLFSGEYVPNAVNGGIDPMVSGSLSSTSPVPDPSSLWLLGSGLAGLAGLVRRKIGQRV